MLTGDEMHEEILPSLQDPQDGSPWRAPAAREQRLYELCREDEAGDDRAGYEYLRSVAAEGLYRPVSLEAAADERGRRPVTLAALDDGRRVVLTYTVGVLPRPHPEVVYEFVTLGGLAAIWPDGVEILAVNAETPCAQWILADEEEREIWGELHEELFRPDELCDRVETRRTGAPADEAMLRGLACGAHLCYSNGDAWNTLHWHGAGYSNEVERLAESWNVFTRDDWHSTQERLLTCEVSPWVWDFVLGTRVRLAHGSGGERVDPVAWRDLVETSIRRQAEEGTDPDELDGFVARLRGLVGEVTRYEARFRADGLLPPDGYVRSVAAWDLGRATMMARWGRGARYATEQEMHAAIERAGKSVQSVYGSWAEFSAGYVLGRCLHFDEDTFGEWYTTVLQAHRALMSDPESPWAAITLH
ncbi:MULTISPECIES: DUF1266 domain-containing protein [Streptosporangium]|uniref:DUF1266 domain-containing protein n=1 Tax=Streptosporangium brasiliense TaxID=47480 RepID=A0ABT9RGL9_9ACTN|nr:DUF1266 domain-containing protein [Streptosporangium brasiliense]MDP9868422.1 hypothetical protein [Streptosporangium brasiliense]